MLLESQTWVSSLRRSFYFSACQPAYSSVLFDRHRPNRQIYVSLVRMHSGKEICLKLKPCLSNASAPSLLRSILTWIYAPCIKCKGILKLCTISPRRDCKDFPKRGASTSP